MKNIILGITLLAVIIGCNNNQITSMEKVRKINQQETISTSEYEELANIFKDETNEIKSRLLALNTLEKHNYSQLEESVRLVLLKTQNPNLKAKLIEKSLKYNNFNYNNIEKEEFLYDFIENKRYEEFFKIYSNEDLSIKKNQLKGLYKNASFKSDLKKVLYLTNYNKDYEIFLESLNKYFDITYEYFYNKNPNWVFKALEENPDLLNNYISKINEKNYQEYKKYLLKGISELSKNGQKRLSSIICSFDSPKEFLLSSNYFLQKEAIKEFGRKKSLKFYNNLSNTKNNYEKFRGLILLGEAEYEEVLNYFRETNKIEYLTLIMFLNTEDIDDILKKSLHKLSIKEKKQAIKMMYNSKIDDQKLSEILFMAIDIEENKEARIIYESVILSLDSGNLLRLFRKIMMGDRYSNLEKTNMMEYLINIKDKNLKSRLLKIGEHNIYSLTLEKESELLLLSDRIKLWEGYLNEISNSSYATEIKNKIQNYKLKLKEIKEDIDLSNNINHLNTKISDLQDLIFSEEDAKKKKIYRAQVEELKKEKQDYLEKKNMPIERRLENLEENYIYYKEKVSGLNQEIYYANQEGDDELVESLKIQKTKNMIEMQTNLEKLRFLYGEYLEKNSEPEEILESDTINALKGR